MEGDFSSFSIPSEVAIGDSWHGPYTVLGNPHPEDTSNTSYHSQISSVFKVQGKKDLYIAVADRWVPDHMDYKYEEYMKAYENIFSPDFDGVPSLGNFGDDTQRNTSIADYVWLPFRFDENGMAFLDWKDEWRLEDYA